MAELALLALWDMWLVRTGRAAISTRIRRAWHRRPVVASVICAGLVWHLARPDRHARYDPLTAIGDHIRR